MTPLTINEESQCEAKSIIASEITLNHSVDSIQERRISPKFNGDGVEKETTKRQLSNLSRLETLNTQENYISTSKPLNQEKQKAPSNSASLGGVKSSNQQPNVITEIKVSETLTNENQNEKINENKIKRNYVKRKQKSLRKGKWTLEEEEYTEKMILLCNSGILSIPTGMTLRSFLAEKLNCDPMRITKKFAGSSCLWKRSQNTSLKPHITVAHADAAFKELSYLEARFRLRIDTGFSGINLDSLSSPFEEYSTVNAMNLNMQPHISKHVAHSRSTPEILRPQNTFSSLAFPSPSINPTMNGINSLLPCAHESFQQMRQNPYALPWAATNLHIDEGSNKSFANDNHLTSDKITSEYLTTTAAQLAISHLAQNAQSHLPWTYGNIGFGNTINANPQTAIPSINNFARLYSKTPNSFHTLLPQEVYKSKRQWQDQYQNKAENRNKRSIDQPAKQESNPCNISSKSKHSNEHLSISSRASQATQRTKEENDSASILLGFLNSLRQNHEAALKKGRDENDSQENNKIISQNSSKKKVTHTISCSSVNSNSSNETEYESSNPQSLNTLNTLPPQPLEISSASSRGSLNDDEYYRPTMMKKNKYSTNFLAELKTKQKKSMTKIEANIVKYKNRYDNILEKNGKSYLSANGSSSDINGSSLSDGSGGYLGGGETDRQSTIDSSEGTKTDQSSASNSSGDDSDKDLSVIKDSRLSKRRKKESSPCPTWPISSNMQ